MTMVAEKVAVDVVDGPAEVRLVTIHLKDPADVSRDGSHLHQRLIIMERATREWWFDPRR